ncbi:unnamed protein product [Chilo suppressalis]|uniref:Protein krueppel n=1 Tax=Chilo suppressalis TaxID=168631 RepID=A0ABN8AZ01_CHISP|nr:hypothetical protein evm_007108 [Chilo suppressalis]CAH0401637.1 unnamed protein product [Chilo suppressalis]
MRDVKACLICLSTDVKLFSIDKNQLRQQYNLITSLQIKKGNGMPEYLCFQCTKYVRNFIKFRDKCHRAYFVMEELLHKEKEINTSRLEALDHHLISIKPYLSYLDVSKAHYEEVKFQWIRNNRLIFMTNDVIPIVNYTTLTKDQMFEKTNANNQETNLQSNQSIKKEKIEMLEIDLSAPVEPCGARISNKCEKSASSCNADNSLMSDDNDNYVDSDIEGSNQDATNNQEADGSALETEYASMHPISRNEAQAANEILKTLSAGKHKCDICSRSYHNENRLKIHMRMHNQHASGNFCCELCNFYYKSNFLLKSHMTEKHMYKYVCKKCPEVSFDRTSAKQHYIWSHMQKRQKTKEEWQRSRPKWLSNKGGARMKGICAVRPTAKKRTKLPDDFLVYSPVSQEEQYRLVKERKNSRNYLEARFKCELCFRGYREQDTYNKHMRKHDPAYSGNAQCDMCKLYFKDARKMYKHMNITHLFKYTCQMCNFVCFNKGQAHMHYRWHKNVTYSCPHCSKEFKKASTRLTHIRIKHPSSFICNLCGHSFVSDSGLYCHKQMSHTAEEIEAFAQVPVDTNSPYYCQDCDVMFVSQTAYDTHLGSSKKHAVTNFSINNIQRERAREARFARTPYKRSAGRPRKSGSSSEILNNGVATSTNCEICNKFLVNDVQARKHYESEHPGADFLKRYMCDVCGHTTKQYANLLVHMRTHTNEKPYQCPHCDRRFSMPSNRDRHLVVHTGEKRYQCQHCNRRFTQSSAVKLHIQTVHLKIPYAPWDKKNRKRRKELEGTSAPVSAVNVPLQPAPKIIMDQDYLNAYINYNDE